MCLFFNSVMTSMGSFPHSLSNMIIYNSSEISDKKFVCELYK